MITKEVILSTISEFSQDNETMEMNANTNDELKFLYDLREKSLILFEGINQTLTHNDTYNKQKQLELLISYLEYQLYVVEERIKNIQNM